MRLVSTFGSGSCISSFGSSPKVETAAVSTFGPAQHANFENTRLLNDFDPFVWLMNQEDSSCLIKIAQYLQKAFNKREKERQAQLNLRRYNKARLHTLIK